MDFEWDPAKAEANLRKHGVPFPQAILIFRDSARIEFPEDASDYAEERWKILGLVQQTVLVVIYTLRDDRVRLISARKANGRERRIYWNGEISS